MEEKLTEDQALEILERVDVVRTGHFVLISGRHSDKYVAKDDISSHPHDLEPLAHTIALHFWDNDVDVVVAPAVGALVLGSRVAYHYGSHVISIFAEQDGDEFVFNRDYSRFIKPGKVVLVVEDIITTGKTTRAMVRAVEALGGEVVGVGLLWNRGKGEFEVPVFACVNKVFPTYAPEECSLCRNGDSIDTDVGHGEKFLMEHGANPKNWPANRK